MALLLVQSLAAHQDPKSQIRIQTQWIEVDLTALKAIENGRTPTGSKFHAAIQKLVTEKKAKLVHSTLLLARSGEKASAESIREVIYPTEIYGSGLSGSFTQQDNDLLKRMQGIGRPHPPAFETRNVGTTLEVEPIHGRDKNYIELRLNPEWVQMPEVYSWVRFRDEQGRSDVKRPVFHTLRSDTVFTVKNNTYQLVNSFAVMDEKGTIDPSRQLLLFVKATIMPNLSQ